MPPTKTITKPRRKLPKDPRDGRPLSGDDRVAILGVDPSGDRSKPFYYVYKFSDLDSGVQDLLKELMSNDMKTVEGKPANLHRMQDGSLRIDPKVVATLDLRFDSWSQDQMFDMTSCDKDWDDETHALDEMDGAEREKIEGGQEKLDEAIASWEEDMRDGLKGMLLNALKDFFYEMGKEVPDPVDKPWAPANGVAITIVYVGERDW